MKWSGCDRVRFMQGLNVIEQEKYRTSAQLFEVLCEMFQPQHKETLLSLQYCKLTRETE